MINFVSWLVLSNTLRQHTHSETHNSTVSVVGSHRDSILFQGTPLFILLSSTMYHDKWDSLCVYFLGISGGDTFGGLWCLWDMMCFCNKSTYEEYKLLYVCVFVWMWSEGHEGSATKCLKHFSTMTVFSSVLYSCSDYNALLFRMCVCVFIFMCACLCGYVQVQWLSA